MESCTGPMGGGDSLYLGQIQSLHAPLFVCSVMRNRCARRQSSPLSPLGLSFSLSRGRRRIPPPPLSSPLSVCSLSSFLLFALWIPLSLSLSLPPLSLCFLFLPPPLSLSLSLSFSHTHTTTRARLFSTSRHTKSAPLCASPIVLVSSGKTICQSGQTSAINFRLKIKVLSHSLSTEQIKQGTLSPRTCVADQKRATHKRDGTSVNCVSVVYLQSYDDLLSGEGEYGSQEHLDNRDEPGASICCVLRAVETCVC